MYFKPYSVVVGSEDFEESLRSRLSTLGCFSYSLEKKIQPRFPIARLTYVVQ